MEGQGLQVLPSMLWTGPPLFSINPPGPLPSIMIYPGRHDARTGHGTVGNKTQLSDSLDMLTAIRDKVATLKQQGKSADEAVAAKPTAQFDAKWATGFVTPDMFVKLVYQGV